MDMALSLLSLASFLAMILAWIAGPTSAKPVEIAEPRIATPQVAS